MATTTTTKTTASSRARKAPQDRKPSQAAVAEAQQRRFEDIEGSEMLKPFSKIKGSDQARMLSRMMRLLGVEDLEQAEGVDTSNMDLEEVADFIDWITERYAVDPEKFEDFTAGKGGMERALNLVMAYAGEVGEGDGSASS